MMRAADGKGVTIPSQIRYVHYFEKIVKDKYNPNLNPKKIIIRKIKMISIPGFSTVGWNCSPTFIIENGEKSYKYFDTEYEMRSIRIDDTIMPEDIQHIIEVGEEIRPTDEIVRRLRKSKINYRE